MPGALPLTVTVTVAFATAPSRRFAVRFRRSRSRALPAAERALIVASAIVRAASPLERGSVATSRTESFVPGAATATVTVIPALTSCLSVRPRTAVSFEIAAGSSVGATA